MKLSELEEKLIIGICNLNRAEKKVEITKTWKFGRVSLTFNWRSKKNLWGRFGGGWNYNLGFQCSDWRDIIFNLLIFSLRFKVVETTKNKCTS